MAILIARHGETPLNRARVVQPADTPLSEAGMWQAQRLAARLLDAGGVGAVVCSDLPRAQMTAEPVERALGLRSERSALLQERNFGDLRGTPYAELREDIFGPDYVPAAGESWAVFEARVERAWAWVLARAEALQRVAGGHLLVVTHGLVCKTLATRHWQLEAPVSIPGYWHNTGVSVVANAPPHQVERINCAAHLDGVPDGSDGISGL